MTTPDNKIRTIGDLKRAIREGRVRKVFVWCNCYGDDGDHFEVSKAALLRGCNADIPFHRDGRPDGAEFYGYIDPDGDLYVDGYGGK
jgi:hypothetical protein